MASPDSRIARASTYESTPARCTDAATYDSPHEKTNQVRGRILAPSESSARYGSLDSKSSFGARAVLTDLVSTVWGDGLGDQDDVGGATESRRAGQHEARFPRRCAGRACP